MLGVILISFFIFLIIGIPIAFAMGLATVAALLSNASIPLDVIAQRFFVAIDSFPLMAVPLFILAGELMNQGGITKAIVEFARTVVGHIRGGLAHVTVVSNMIMAGVSGSASADASAIGSMMIPTMVKAGFAPEFAVAVSASASTIGPIIPPSILMVLYGSMTGLSIGALFLGGVIPGILIGLALMVTAYIISVKHGYRAEARAALKEVWQRFRDALGAMIMPLIIVGGILSGVFTATEAGVVAVVYGFIVGMATRELNLSKIKPIFIDSAIVSSSVMLIIGAAQGMSWVLARELFPQVLMNFLLSISQNPTLVLLMILGATFILGFFIDVTPLLIIMVPVLFPIQKAMHYDPIHFAVLVIIVLLIGAITPPVGMCLFISCNIAKIPLVRGSRVMFPFVAAMLAITLLLIFIPGLITGLPGVFIK